MKKIIFILALNLNFFFLSAQSTLSGGFTKGYIVTKTDTIHCYVLNRNHFLNCSAVKYKFTKEDKAQEIEIDNILEVYDNSSIYKKITYHSQSFLAIQRIKGTVSLFEVNDSHQADQFAVSDGRTTVSGGQHIVENCTFYLVKSDMLLRIEKRSYKEDLNRILTDDPETTKKIDKLKFKDLNSMIRLLVNNYNTSLNTKKIN